jgi:hypothetical protein
MPPPVPVDPRTSRFSSPREMRSAAKLRADAARAANSCSKRVLSGARTLIKASVGNRKSLTSIRNAKLDFLGCGNRKQSRRANGLRVSGGRCHLLVWRTQTISDPCFRQDVLRTFRMRLDLLPELSNVYTKILRIGQIAP